MATQVNKPRKVKILILKSDQSHCFSCKHADTACGLKIHCAKKGRYYRLLKVACKYYKSI